MEKIAIIIVNYKDYAKKYLVDFYSSLKGESHPYQLFIVDNESSTDSIAFIGSVIPEAIIVTSDKNLGYSGGMNLGAAKAGELGYKYLLFMNFDLEVEPGFLNELVKIFEQSGAGAIQPRVMMYPDKDKVNSLGNSIHYLGFGFSAGGYQKFDQDKFQAPFEIAYASGVCFLMKTELFEKLGGFQNDFFMYHEDLDLGWKIRLAGNKILLAPQSVIYHKFQFSTSMRQYYWMERNRFITTLKNYKLATLLVFLPPFLFMEIGQLIFAVKNRTFLIRLKVYGQFFTPAFWLEISAGRKFVRSIRQVKDREILQFFVGEIKFQEIDNPLLKYIANPVLNVYFGLMKLVIFW